ncbi:MAG: hypothetical protein ACXWKC_06765 [Xanthobacteraceae bacterium]
MEDNQKKSDEEGRVVPFRPRAPSHIEAFSNLANDRSPVDDFRKYAQGGEHGDDYVHRMKVNAIAVLFLAALVGAGIWIVDIMAQQRKGQDCVLSGRRNCATVAIPADTR